VPRLNQSAFQLDRFSRFTCKLVCDPVVSDLSRGDGVVIHADSEVRGLLVLLRSKNHPDGFRYELLLTELTDHGKSYPLTASLNSSFHDAGVQPPAATSPIKIEQKELPKPSASANTGLTVVSSH
jgi:hypothetical protein